MGSGEVRCLWERQADEDGEPVEVIEDDDLLMDMLARMAVGWCPDCEATTPGIPILVRSLRTGDKWFRHHCLCDARLTGPHLWTDRSNANDWLDRRLSGKLD